MSKRGARLVQTITLLFALCVFTMPTLAAYGALPSSANPLVIQKYGLDAGESSEQIILPNIDGASSTPLEQPSTTWGPIDKTKAPYTTLSSGVSAARTGNTAYWVAGKMSAAYKRGLGSSLYAKTPWTNYLTEEQSTLSVAVSVAVPSAASGLESPLITGYGAVLGPSMIVKKGTTELQIGIDYRIIAKPQGNYAIQALTGGKLAAGGTVSVRSKFIVSGSGGELRINTPLSDYYSAKFSFYYAMPSIGSGEQFYALQLYAGDGSVEHDERYVNALSTNWKQVEYDLTSASKSLSRSSTAYVAMRFVDVKTGQEAAEVGAGPRIDDLVLTGYKYGPVRNLKVSPQGRDLMITWDKPYRAFASEVIDDRPLAYRVWRAEAGSDNFVELTSGVNRVSVNSFADQFTVDGKQYQYLVQAWDGSGGAAYGEFAPRSARTEGVIPLSISFDSRDGSAVAPIEASYNALIVAPTAPTKTGYTFGGWYKDAAYTTMWDFANDTVVADMTLYAKWTADPRTVTFDSQGGSSVAPLNTTYGAKIAAPIAPAKLGHTFVGWYKDQAYTDLWDFANNTVTADITLYAKWTTNSYTVTFASQGGSEVASADTSYGSKLSAPAAPTKTGHTFGGWYKDSALTTAWDFANDTVVADMTLYAKWTPQVYTVKFVVSGNTAATRKVDYSTTTLAPTSPTKSGYRFMGWYSSTGVKFSPTAPVIADATYTARFYSTNAYLAKLSASTGKWSNRFSKTRYAYTLTIARTKSKVKIAATKAQKGATVSWSYNRTKWYSGATKVVSVSRGKSKYLYFKVISQSKKTSKIYKIKVYRKR